MPAWPENRRDAAVAYALLYVGTWYSWGGDDPSGFDCSGLITEVGQSVGAIGRKEDYTAEGWRQLAIACGAGIPAPIPGCLVFFGEREASHVAIAINSWQMIEAAGGGRHVTTKDAAIKANAFIKVRPIRSRKNVLGYADIAKF